jgi:hypothetical protein
MIYGPGGATPDLMEIDPRLQRRPSEKLFPKRYASCFKGTALEQMLSALGVDTVIVVGVSSEFSPLPLAIAQHPQCADSVTDCSLALIFLFVHSQRRTACTPRAATPASPSA